MKPKIQVAIYGSGGSPVIEGNEPSDDKVTIPVNLGDLPSPQGGGVKGENSFVGLLSDFAEFLGFTENAVNTIEEVQGNSSKTSNNGEVVVENESNPKPDTTETGNGKVVRDVDGTETRYKEVTVEDDTLFIQTR